MRKGSMLAGLRPRDDEDESALEEDEAPESEPAPKARPVRPSQVGVPKPTPEETRAIDLRIFDAADKLEAKLGRKATAAEIVDAAKVPGATQDGRKQRVSVALRRRALLTETAKKPSSGAQAKKAPELDGPSWRPGDKGYRAPAAPVAAAPLPARAQPDQTTLGVRAVEDLRDRLRRQLDAVEVTLAALRGER